MDTWGALYYQYFSIFVYLSFSLSRTKLKKATVGKLHGVFVCVHLYRALNPEHDDSPRKGDARTMFIFTELAAFWKSIAK